MIEKAADTKTAIRSIAKDLMRHLGYNAFSYADIAKKLNIKNAAIHYYYPGKADLLADVIQNYIDEYVFLGKQLEEASVDPLLKMKKFIEKYSVLIDLKCICIIGSVASDYNTLPESVRSKVSSLIELVVNMVAKTLAEGNKKGIFHFNELPRVKALLILTNLAAGVQLARITGKQDYELIEAAIIDQLK